jgi:uncharacterized protein (TIGR02145 family)
MGKAEIGEPEYGTFTDERDERTYKTVKMPDGKVWMAQNLNYKPESGNSWCYDNDESIGEKYGRLYDWDTAMAVSPLGWHLPSQQEWNDLILAVGDTNLTGKKLKAKNGWDDYYDGSSGNGSDDFGFSALPGGYLISDDYFEEAGKEGCWWTATEHPDGYVYYQEMGFYFDNVCECGRVKGYGCSVRCVADN